MMLMTFFVLFADDIRLLCVAKSAGNLAISLCIYYIYNNYLF